eukprot:UN07824
MQTIRGVEKPVFGALKLLYTLGSTVAYNTSRIDANNHDGTVQIYTLKNKNSNNRYAVYVANWNLHGQSISNQMVQIKVQGNGIPKTAIIYRIDEDNVNPVSKWQSMNSPVYPSATQLQTLNESAQLVSASISFSNVDANTVQFDVTLPTYGVAVIDI